MTQKSPNLEVVLNEQDVKALRKRIDERRRLPRLNLAGEQFKLSTGKIFSVSNLSNDGMALRVLERADLEFFPIATRIQGTLKLAGQKFETRAIVRHLGGDAVGCQFDGISEDLKAVLARFLDPEELGRELKPIPASELGAVWYRGPSGTNLLLWRANDGQYRRIALFVLGNYMQWDESSGLTTGQTHASDECAEVRGIVHFETMLLDVDEKPDPKKLEVAKKLLMSSNLPQDLKKWCVRQFS
ncbi:MAG TPA: PilZ domain-containing protein [Bdellovibrionota bacterium]|nr:PilZ domain-containing protein [Bdellovibrionota bacterium]